MLYKLQVSGYTLCTTDYDRIVIVNVSSKGYLVQYYVMYATHKYCRSRKFQCSNIFIIYTNIKKLLNSTHEIS